MKTLIAYATNHGATRKYAEALAGRIAGVELVDLKQNPQPDLSAYDTVVIGTAVYYGQPLKPAKEFCARHLELLRSKRLGLFVCSLNVGAAEQIMEGAFPSELREVAKAYELFGGEVIMKKLGFGERLIARTVMKSSADISRYSEEPLGSFIAALGAEQPR